MKKTIIIVFILCFNSSVFAQISEGGLPISLLDTTLFNMQKNFTPAVQLPYFDNNYEEIKASEYKANICENCENKYYGIGIHSIVNIIEEGNMFELETGGKLWLMKFESPTAYGLQFYFNEFSLPEGAHLYIFNKDKNIILGKYTSRNNPTNNNFDIKFGTQYIEGNEIFMEYYEPPNPEFSGQIQVSRIIHIFKNIFESGGPFSGGWGAGECNVNVACPEGNTWKPEINSVAIIIIYSMYRNSEDEIQEGYIGLCSGALINNTAEDGMPLFLTAAHCADPVDVPIQPNEWIFLFNHQSNNCNSNGSDVPSSIAQSIYGAEILSIDNGSSLSD